jgi:hypothetical protein
MTTPGWIMMLVSVGFVIGLLLFCFYRVLTTPKSEKHMHGPLDIDTGDQDPYG